MKPDSLGKKIVIINQDSGYLMIDIVNAFCEKYDKVVLLSGAIRPMNVKLSNKVKIRWIARYSKKNTFTRSASWIMGMIQSTFLLNFMYRRYEVFATSNPPLLSFLPMVCRNKISLLVYDVYPDGLVAEGFIGKGSLINKLWSHWNRKAFKRLHALITLTPEMAKALSNYIEPDKISVIAGWTNQVVGNYNTKQGNDEFIRKYQLKDKFLVVYSGNLGRGYNLEMLVYLAEKLKEEDQFRILIIGDGYKKNELEKLISSLGLSNCLLLQHQPAEIFLQILYATHIGVVALENETTNLSIPSKTYNILGAAKPILCLGSHTSDLAAIIDKYHIGATFAAYDLLLMTDFVKRIVLDKRYYLQLCANARIASNEFTSRNALLMVENHLSN